MKSTGFAIEDVTNDFSDVMPIQKTTSIVDAATQIQVNGVVGQNDA